MEQSGVRSGEIGSSARKVSSVDELLTKILAGLPLTSLRLFRSVCKRWCSLITDPAFGRNPNADRPYGLLLQLQSASSEFAYLPLNKAHPLILSSSFPFYPTTSEYIMVLQSCKGLLLCYDCPNKIYVYSPTVNQCKLLPLPHVWEANINRFVEDMAVAFDPAVSPHYKILYARKYDRTFDVYIDPADKTLYARGNYRTSGVHIEIYSSETGTWRAYAQTFHQPSFATFDRRVVYWRGALHWLSRKAIYHFSLDLENPHFIHVEEHNALHGITYGVHDKLLVSSCDCLLLVRMLQPLHLNIYQMKNTECYSSGWSIKYHVNLEESVSFPGREVIVLAIVLGVGEADSFLVLEVTGVRLIRYNIMSKTYHQLCDPQIPIRRTKFCSFLFTPSLVGV